MVNAEQGIAEFGIKRMTVLGNPVPGGEILKEDILLSIHL